ncbi:hypothetical protein GGR42_000964 [Saonia flava]|uniref:Uncharacterized protein n=1 Tax=Saonia flava TaxID=523696 RepID=A0A846QVA7_9FLAO|nr:hypothetical protein [Saonia flava]NJB70502.1 hypothetical protein [Saonia flava]
MKRRKFFLLTATGAAIIAIPSWYYFHKKKNRDNTLLSNPDMLAQIWDEETLLNIGKKYYEENPEERSEKKLLKTLSKNISSFKPNLNEVIQEDYKSGRIIIVDGWFISVTEACQCALYYLKQTKS